MEKEDNLLIILDLGANDGCSILKFKKIIKDKQINNYKIYSFEPNPFFKKRLEDMTKSDENVIFSNKLVGTQNTKTQLFLSHEGNEGSSIYSDKQTNNVRSDKYVICETIDIAEFIIQLPSHNKLWLKMDIEGSEYNIIPHLHKKNCLKKIDKLLVEWHYHKIPSITKKMHDNTVRLVKNIDSENWDALDYRNKDIKYRQEYQSFLKKIKQSPTKQLPKSKPILNFSII